MLRVNIIRECPRDKVNISDTAKTAHPKKVRCCFKGDNMKDKTESITRVICAVILLMSVATKVYDYIRQKVKTDSAAAEAEMYISDKYGFVPESVEVSEDPYLPHFESDFSFASFKASDGIRSFTINYQESDGELFCRDDYQREEIYSAAEKYITEGFENGSIYYMYLGCESPFTGDVYLDLMDKDAVFDGGNITDILEKSKGRLGMVFYGTGFSQSEISEVLPADNIDIEFASFDTKEHMDEFYNGRIKNNKHYYRHFYEELEKYAPHVTDYLKIDSDGVTGFDVTVQKNDEFRYAYFPVEPNAFVTSKKITARLSGEHRLAEIFANHGEEVWLNDPVSKEYYFDSAYGDVWIYYPLERLEGYDIENVGLAWYSGGGMSNNRNIERAQICGDYAVFNMPFGRDTFMLVNSNSLEEYVPDFGF